MKSILAILTLASLFLLSSCRQESGDNAPTDPDVTPETEVSSGTSDSDAEGSADAGTSTMKLNINEASREALLAIPETGDRMVHEFFEYRPFVSISQFRREIGKYVDEARVASYEEYIYVPVDPDASDAQTLQQLPGVDAEIAAALIAARPFGSAEAFMEALGEHVGGEELTVAAQYVSAK